MLVRSIENTSKNNVEILLENGNKINLPASGKLEDIKVSDLSGVQKFLKVRYALND